MNVAFSAIGTFWHSIYSKQSTNAFIQPKIDLSLIKSLKNCEFLKCFEFCVFSNRTCQHPIYSKQGTKAFIQPKMGRDGDEVDSPQVRQGPARLARPAAGFFSSIGDQTQEEGTQDEGEGAGQIQAPPTDRPQQRVMTIPRPIDEIGGINEGGLEIMSAVRTHTARQILKRKKKVSGNGLLGVGAGEGGMVVLDGYFCFPSYLLLKLLFVDTFLPLSLFSFFFFFFSCCLKWIFLSEL